MPDTGAQIDAIPADIYHDEIQDINLLPRGTNAIAATGSPIISIGTFEARIRWPTGKKSKLIKTPFTYYRILNNRCIEDDSKSPRNVASWLPSREHQRDQKGGATKLSWLQVFSASHGYSRNQPDGREEEGGPKPVNGRPSPHLWRNLSTHGGHGMSFRAQGSRDSSRHPRISSRLSPSNAKTETGTGPPWKAGDHPKSNGTYSLGLSDGAGHEERWRHQSLCGFLNLKPQHHPAEIRHSQTLSKQCERFHQVFNFLQ